MFFIFLLFAEFSLAVTCANGRHDLHLVHARDQRDARAAATVEFSVTDDFLEAKFTVKSRRIYGVENLRPGQYPFHFDVVEVFVSTTEATLPYYEFQLTPFGQTMQVKVLDPKKSFENGLDFGVETRVERSRDGWIGHLRIPLQNLAWDGNPAHLRGNAFMILGKAPARTYWSSFLPAQKKPSFHQPQFFAPLLDCEER